MRKNAEHGRNKAPDSAEMSQNRHGGVRPCGETLGRLLIVGHDVHRVEILLINAVPLQYAPGEFALSRSKAKLATRIALQHELHQTIAEPADTVVENQRVRITFHKGRNSAGRELRMVLARAALGESVLP